MPIQTLKGDATLPQGTGPRVICHICNDIGAWGAGFVIAVSKRYPQAEKAYREWSKELQDQGKLLPLGEVQFVPVGPDLWVASMIGQRGIGFDKTTNLPPIRYDAVRGCLAKASFFAKGKGATLHMPQIGAGLAGGDWTTIEQIISEETTKAGVDSTIYLWDKGPAGAPKTPSTAKPDTGYTLGI